MKQAEVPVEFSGITDAALLKASMKWANAGDRRDRLELTKMDARLVELGLVSPTDGLPCPFALVVVWGFRRHGQVPTVGEIRAIANQRRRELDLPLLPEPEVA